MFDNLKKKVCNVFNFEEKQKEDGNQDVKPESETVCENLQNKNINENTKDCIKNVSEKIEKGATVVGETLKSGCEKLADSKVVEYGGKTIDAAGEVVENVGKKVVETGKKIINSEEVKGVQQSINDIGNNIDNFAQKQFDAIKDKIKNFNKKGEE